MKEIRFLLDKVPLFNGVSEETAKQLLQAEGSRLISYEKDEFLCQTGVPLDGMLILTAGHAEVTRGSVLLRDLAAGDITGVSALYSGDTRMETDIRAKTKVTALFFPREAVTAALRQDAQLAENYVVFLSGRIRFLNRVIRRFAGSDTTGRLARYLLEKSRTFGPSFELSPTRAAAALGMGRASLYRALDALQKTGCIEKNEKQITILDEDQISEMIDV